MMNRETVKTLIKLQAALRAVHLVKAVRVADALRKASVPATILADLAGRIDSARKALTALRDDENGCPPSIADLMSVADLTKGEAAEFAGRTGRVLADLLTGETDGKARKAASSKLRSDDCEAALYMAASDLEATEEAAA